MISAGRIRVADEGAIVPSSCLARLEVTLPSVRSCRNTSNNKNAIKKLNESLYKYAPREWQEWRWEKEQNEKKKKDCAKRAEQREAEEGTVNLLCISSTGSYEDKLQREVLGPY